MNVIKFNEVYTPKEKIKVIVKTITFNQSEYIQDTLNSIANQKTNFPFVNIVLEDNSTDGEQEVIKLWLERECEMSLAQCFDIPTADVIVAPHRTNHNCTFAIYFHKANLFRQKEKREAQLNPWRLKSDYEALCEGDDYWTDPLKLQKQVDFMDNNPDYSLCFHAHEELYKNGIVIPIRRYENDINDISKNDMILGGGGFMATNSMLFRLSMYNNYPKWASDAPIGDYPLMLVLLCRGKVSYISDVMSVYRIAANGSWSNTMMYSKRKLLKHKSQIFKMLKAFNKWSNKEYQSCIYKMLLLNIKDRIKITLKILLRLN